MAFVDMDVGGRGAGSVNTSMPLLITTSLASPIQPFTAHYTSKRCLACLVRYDSYNITLPTHPFIH